MSVTHSGHETWLRFARQAGLGTVGSTWNLWDTGEADSLVFGETPDERATLYGARGKRRYTTRRGLYLPGGGLPAYPVNQGTTSPEFDAILVNFWQGSAVSADGASYNHTFTATAQQDPANWEYLTFQKDTAITGSGEQYLDCLTDSISIDWEAAGKMTITPTIKALTASQTTVTGTGDPITAGFVVSPNLVFTWNGNTITPQSFNLTLNNTIPDVQGPSSRGRQKMFVGDFTGEFSLGLWRDDSTADYFRAPYGSADPTGTLVVTWDIDSTYGLLANGDAPSGTITAYCAPNWLDMASQAGDLIESVSGQILHDTSMSITSDSATI